MKKFIIAIVCLGAAMLTACASTPVKEAGETTAVVEDFVNPIGDVEISNEEDTSDLDGCDRYSKEYIDELFYNTIGDESEAQSEWDDLEAQGYDETQIKYIMLLERGFIG